MSDLISLIVPVYKVEEVLLRNSIESILQQSYQNIEILIVDDGSPDESGKICDEYAISDSRVQVFHIENGGVSKARNYALKQANGEYVFFVDSDDYIEPECIAVLYEQIKINDADCAMCSAYHVNEVDVIRSNNVQSDFFLKTHVLNQKEAMDTLFYLKQPFEGFEVGAIWGCLFKKDAIGNILFNTKMKVGEDFEFKYRVFLKINRFVCINKKYYNYLIRVNSAMRNGFDAAKVDTVDQLAELIHNNMHQCEYLNGLISRATNIAIVILFMVPIGKEYEEYRRRIKLFIKKYRVNVLKNKQSRKKVKIAMLTSYFGFDFTQWLFQMLN